MIHSTDVIVVTGAAGFIGSYLCSYLNRNGYEQLILVDDFSIEKKAKNLSGKKFLKKIDRKEFLANVPEGIDYIFHLGARTDTTEMDYNVHKELNLDYSKDIWKICTERNVPLLYASSAATYGGGELGYKDNHDIISELNPLNPYGKSKNEFDIWALAQNATPPFWAGVKFFNVFGPNEYHKGRMASVIYHAYHQIQQNKYVKLFRSHHPDYKDGEQKRDFIYVNDVVKKCVWLMNYQPENGLYNIGTGKASTFNELVSAIFIALEMPVDIRYIDTPEDIRDKYQYYTEADMEKLIEAGYNYPIISLNDSVRDYVTNYLEKETYF